MSPCLPNVNMHGCGIGSGRDLLSFAKGDEVHHPGNQGKLLNVSIVGFVAPIQRYPHHFSGALGNTGRRG